MGVGHVFTAGPRGFLGERFIELVAWLTGRTGGSENGGARSPIDQRSAAFEEAWGLPLPRELVQLGAVSLSPIAFAVMGTQVALVVDGAVDGGGDGGHGSGENLMLDAIARAQGGDWATLASWFAGAVVFAKGPGEDLWLVEVRDPGEKGEWEPQVLRIDGETGVVRVVADSVESALYLMSLHAAHAKGGLSASEVADGVALLTRKVVASWPFAVDAFDPEFADYEFSRSPIWFERSAWVRRALVDGVIDEAAAPASADAERDEEPGVTGTLYRLWSSLLRGEPVASGIGSARMAKAKLLRDAAELVDELSSGRRNDLGAVRDVRGIVNRVRSQAAPRSETDSPSSLGSGVGAPRQAAIEREVAATARRGLADIGWRTIGDRNYHRVLLRRLDTDPAVHAQLLELHRGLTAEGSEASDPLADVALRLDPALEVVLAGALVRGDVLDDVLDLDPYEERGAALHVAEATLPVRADLDAEVETGISLLRRAISLAPDDSLPALALLGLLIKADRTDDILAELAACQESVAVRLVIDLGTRSHPRFADALAVLFARIPVTAGIPAALDVAPALWVDLVAQVATGAPERIADVCARLPDDVNLLAEAGYHMVSVRRREDAIAVYDRLFALPVPIEGTRARRNYVGALNNACMQAFAAGDVVLSARIADQAQPYARENPHVCHSSACAYAAIGDWPRAMAQVRAAIEFGYEHLDRLEHEPALGSLRELPEFQLAFARRKPGAAPDAGTTRAPLEADQPKRASVQGLREDFVAEAFNAPAPRRRARTSGWDEGLEPDAELEAMPVDPGAP